MNPAPAVAADPVVAWLLEPDNPGVRWQCLRTLLGQPDTAAEVAEARAAIAQRGVVPAILAAQNPDGSWVEPKAFYTDKYCGTVWQLLILAELGASGDDPRVRRAGEFLLAHSQDPDTGGFSVQARARGGGGLPSMVIPCLTGNLAWAMQVLGFYGDPRIDRALDWLATYLRFDDGDTAPPDDFRYVQFEVCYGRHSCFMGVVKGLKALAQVPPAQRTPAMRATIAAGCEYMLLHHVHKRSHAPEHVAKPGWTHLGFPRMYQSDVLEVLMILQDLGCDDPRMDDALDVVRRARQPDGRWLLADTFNGKFVVDIERKGAPSKWVTLRALQVLQRADAARRSRSDGRAGTKPAAAQPVPGPLPS
ncbi:MAG: terpene cyclase/mutase family protein [Deltaproteobacteria bacterium]|nr:terpene cyclase/mutase family protein [Deltaproteobacteria bacterium]